MELKAAAKAVPFGEQRPPTTGRPATKAGNASSGLALGKTMMVATSARTAAATSPVRLPTEAEAREQPALVVRLDKAASPPNTGAPKVPADASAAAPPPSVEPAPVGTAAPAAASAEEPSASPTDLPPPGWGKPFRLPQPGDKHVARESSAAPNAEGSTLVERASSAFGLLHWALRTYLRRPLPWLALTAALVLPIAFVESLLLAAVARGADPATLVLPGVATVDLSQSKAALARRIQTSQAKGTIDAQAAAALAALTAAEGASTTLGPGRHGEEGSWREYVARFIAGLLLFGVAVPLAFVAVAIAAVDAQGGATLPGLADVGPILLARRELFLLSLLPAGLLVAIGNVLFVLPGVALMALFLFVPQAVVFERRRGRAALERSIELVRADAVRVLVTFVALALAGFVIAVLTGLVLPLAGSRATVFLNVVVSVLCLLAVLPVPALALSRIYVDLRARAGATPERLSRAART